MWYRLRFYELTKKCDLSFHTEGGYCDLQILLLPAWHILTSRSPASFSPEPLGSSYLPKLVCKEEPPLTEKMPVLMLLFGLGVWFWSEPLHCCPWFHLFSAVGTNGLVSFQVEPNQETCSRKEPRAFHKKVGLLLPGTDCSLSKVTKQNKTKHHQKHTQTHQGERGKGQILSRTCKNTTCKLNRPIVLAYEDAVSGYKILPKQRTKQKK